MSNLQIDKRNTCVISVLKYGRFMFEWIHYTKEQIYFYFYERVGNDKAKERLFESFK